MDKARQQRLELGVILVLPRGGERRERAAVEALFEREDRVSIRAVGLGCVLARGLDGALVRLGAGVGEEDALHARALAEELREIRGGRGVKQVRDVLHLPELRRDGGDPLGIRNAEGVHADAAREIDVPPAGLVEHLGAAAGDDLHREAGVGMGDVGLVGLHGVHGGIPPFMGSK